MVIALLAALLARPLALLASSVALEAMAFSSMADRSTPAEESACGAWQAAAAVRGRDHLASTSERRARHARAVRGGSGSVW